MNTTKAMLIIGLLMLVLAVIVARELRPADTVSVGSSVSGAVSKTPEPPVDPVPAEPVTPPAATPANGTLVPLDSGTVKPEPAKEPAQASPATSAPVQPLAEGQTAQQVQAPKKEESAPQRLPMPQSPEVKAPEKQTVTTVAPKTIEARHKAVSRTRLDVSDTALSSRLTGVAPIKGKAFALNTPDRIVVDLQGLWSIALAKTPDNKFLQAVRSGQNKENTRLVFDLKRAAKTFKLVQIDAKTLELQAK